MQMSHVKVLTIDGPSGVGKGSVSMILAKKLGWNLLDSGALYRLTALAAKRQNIDFDNVNAIAEIAKNLDIEFRYDSELVQTYLNGEDVSLAIRTEEMGTLASKIARENLVRQALLQRQRDFLQPPGLICDGRDMGSTIFPNADLKIFLTASAQIRAQRRYKQLQNSNKSASIATLLASIEARDEADRTRKDSPLRPGVGAKIIETDNLSIEEVVAKIESYFTQAGISR